MSAMVAQNSPNALEATESVLDRLGNTLSNEEFLANLRTGA